MDENILRYTDLAATIQLARSAGMTTVEIVRVLASGRPYRETRELAKRAAPLLDISVAEFMRLRRNR